jgi:flagellar secretion chaperone FliS
METKARDAYLEAQIMTATPQKLRLMLVDAALRNARMAAEAIRDDRSLEAFEAGERCQRILSELIGSIRQDASDVASKVLALYVYLFRECMEGQLRREPAKYDNVVRVLEIEQETWREVCLRMPHAPQADDDESRQISSSGMAPIAPSSPLSLTPPDRGFSLDA